MKYLLLILFLFCNVASGEVFHPDASTQYTRGGVTKTYTPRNYTPLPDWRNCPMCESIKEGWRSWERSKFGSTWDDLQNGRVTVAASNDDDDEYETIEVQETRYRTEKRCQIVGYGAFGRPIKQCYNVNVPYTVMVKKRVKKAKTAEKPPKPVPEVPPIELKVETTVLPTPVKAIRSLFSRLKPTGRMTVVDAGSGDGRVLIEASRAGYRAIGVELEPKNVATSRERIRKSGFPAIVHQGNAVEFDYSQADIVYIYQYPDLMEKIVKRLPRGKRVVSYMHPIPGVECKSYSVGDGQTFYVGVVGGVVEQKQTLTFGL